MSAFVQVEGCATPGRFTARQVQILQLLAVGKTEGEMAQILGLATPTIHNIIRRQYPKLGASTRTGLVWEAMARGLIVPPSVRQPLAYPLPAPVPKAPHVFPKDRLLALLRSQAGRTVRLCELEAFGDASCIRQLIRRVRAQVGRGERIVTVVGVGYRYEMRRAMADAGRGEMREAA